MSRLAITADDLSPLVEIVVWFTLVATILTVLGRIGIKVAIVRRIDSDDFLISLSLFFAVGQSIAVATATSNGLGQRMASLDEGSIESQLKAEYAATILFILACCFAKLSLIAFLRALTPVESYLRNGVYVACAILAWTVTSLFTAAFQCGVPRPWDYLNGTCFNRAAWADYVAIGNIVTDTALIILPVVIVLRLKVVRRKKALLITVFFLRIFVIAAAICQLVFRNQVTATSDSTFDIWPLTICTQIVQCLSVLTACTFYLKPLLDSFQSGFMQVSDLRRQNISGFGFNNPSASRRSKLSSRLFNVRPKRRLMFSKPQTTLVSEFELQKSTDEREPNIRLGELGNTAVINGESHEWDASSQSHILCTTSWTVRGNSPPGEAKSETKSNRGGTMEPVEEGGTTERAEEARTGTGSRGSAR